jgi:hypothetical protein
MIFLFVVSCSSNKEIPAVKKVIIAGKVLNQDPMTFKITISVNWIGLGQQSFLRYLKMMAVSKYHLTVISQLMCGYCIK